MEEIQLILLKILTNIDGAVCLLGAIMLFIRGKNNRARTMLGYTLLLWGVCCIARMITLETGMMPLLLHPLRLEGLIGGNIIYILLLLFPLEVLLPGWLNLKRLFMLMIPNLVVTLFFVGMLSVLNQDVIKLNSFSDIFTHIHQFNVWFRFFYYVLIASYIVLWMKLFYRYEEKYIQWRNDNYSDVEQLDISWMRYYAYFLMVIFSTWMFNTLVASVWNHIIHIFISTFIFAYYSYKGLFYESAYPEDFFKYMNTNPFNMSVPLHEELPFEKTDMEPEKFENTISFAEKMPSYVETFTSWMDKEKPYLHRDFKLTDVAKVLPLNRSYLSRVFNEGLGRNFCHVVRGYRIESAKKLLREYPKLPIYIIAERCGFSSDAMFIKAFQKEMNMTPMNYRKEISDREDSMNIIPSDSSSEF